MKRNKLLIIFGFSISLFLFSFFLGYSLVGNNTEKDIAKQNRIAENEDLSFNDYEDIHITKKENKISPNTFIEKRTNYKKCGHLISDIISPEEEIINMDEEEYEKYLSDNYPNLKLISFSNKKIVIWGERNHLCEKHFIVGEKDGYIAVFKIGENGEKVVENIYKGYPISMLMPIDREKLKEGIIVDTEEELSDLLENFIS